MQARNVIAARCDHPLLVQKKPIRATQLAEYPWIAPPENSPLRSDLQTSLLAAGLQNIKIAYSGAGLAGQLNYLKNSDCLTVLPHGVVIELRHQREVTALPFPLTAPVRSLGLLSKKKLLRAPVTSLLEKHFISEFELISTLIRRDESTVLWGNSSGTV